MTCAGGTLDAPFMELTIALPAGWNISAEGIKNPATWEPIKLLKELAHYPNANRTFFEKYHTFAVDDRPGLKPMKAVLLMPPVLVPELRDPLRVTRDRKVHFMGLYLLHQDELQLKLAGGLADLFELFIKNESSELYDISRKSVLS